MLLLPPPPPPPPPPPLPPPPPPRALRRRDRRSRVLAEGSSTLTGEGSVAVKGVELDASGGLVSWAGTETAIGDDADGEVAALLPPRGLRAGASSLRSPVTGVEAGE